MDVIILMAFHQQASLQFQLMQDVSHDLVAETATVSVWGVREWGAGWSGNCGSSSAWGGACVCLPSIPAYAGLAGCMIIT